MSRVEIASMPWGVLQDRHGESQNGLTATLKNLNGTNATTWSAVTGGSSSTASLTADVNGNLPRFVDGGQYTLDVPALGVSGRRVEAVSGSVESGAVPTTGPFVLSASAPAALNRLADFRCTGTNDHVTVQAAVDAAGTMPVFLSPGQFNYAGGVLSTATAAPGGIIGAGRAATVISQTDPAAYVYEYRSPLSAPYHESMGLAFERMTIRARFGVKINQRGDYATIFSQQAFLYGVGFRDIYFDGPYDTLTDANRDTLAATTQAEVEAFGIAVDLAKCFDPHIVNCIFKEHGCAVVLDGCDIAKLDHVRFHAGARHLYVFGHDSFGGRWQADHCEFLVNRRMAGINIVGTSGWRIRDSYFENTGTPSQYLFTTGDLGGAFIANYISNAGVVGESVLRFGGRETTIRDNYSPTTVVGVVDVAADTYFQQKPVLARWENNQNIPKPTQGLVNSRDTVERYLLAADNFDPACTLYGNVVSGSIFPWITSPTTGRKVLQTAAPSGTATTVSGSPSITSVTPTTGWQNGMAISGTGIPAGATIVSGAGTATMVLSANATASASGVAINSAGMFWRVPLRSVVAKSFELRMTGRFLSGTADAHTLTYTEDAVTTTVSSGTLGFAATAEVETIVKTFSLPTTGYGGPGGAAKGTGQFDLTINNDRVEYEQIEFVPLVRQRAVPSIASATTMVLTDNPTSVLYKVTGSTTIDNISGGWPGREITLLFTAACSIRHFGGSGNLRLAGSVDFAAGVDDMLTLMMRDTGVWYEKARAVI